MTQWGLAFCASEMKKPNCANSRASVFHLLSNEGQLAASSDNSKQWMCLTRIIAFLGQKIHLKASHSSLSNPPFWVGRAVVSLNLYYHEKQYEYSSIIKQKARN